jgi:hypothetical protein
MLFVPVRGAGGVFAAPVARTWLAPSCAFADTNGRRASGSAAGIGARVTIEDGDQLLAATAALVGPRWRRSGRALVGS